jgi:hypothetical protein
MEDYWLGILSTRVHYLETAAHTETARPRARAAGATAELGNARMMDDNAS